MSSWADLPGTGCRQPSSGTRSSQPVLGMPRQVVRRQLQSPFIPERRFKAVSPPRRFTGRLEGLKGRDTAFWWPCGRFPGEWSGGSGRFRAIWPEKAFPGLSPARRFAYGWKGENGGERPCGVRVGHCWVGRDPCCGPSGWVDAECQVEPEGPWRLRVVDPDFGPGSVTLIPRLCSCGACRVTAAFVGALPRRARPSVRHPVAPSGRSSPGWVCPRSPGIWVVLGHGG